MHSQAQIPTPTGERWLCSLVELAVRRDCRLKTNCSTCGARPVLDAMQTDAAIAAPLLPYDEIVQQLATPPAGTSSDAIRLVIYALYRRLGREAHYRLAAALRDVPAGDELARMKAHCSAERDQRQINAFLNSPEYGAERWGGRASRHADRVAAKAIRDAHAWQ